MNETELVGNEMTYLKPRISKTRAIVEALIGAALIIGFIGLLYWLASL
jgi:hypothetical protein